MYLSNNSLKSAFKKRPPEYIPGVGWQDNNGKIKPNKQVAPSDAVAPVVPDFNIPDDNGEIEGHDYKFNVATGIPKTIADAGDVMTKSFAGRPLTFVDHAKKRARQKGLDFDADLGHLNNSFPLPEHGFSPVEIEVAKHPKGSRVSKLVMRGPREGKSDAVMPVITNEPGRLIVPTVWANRGDDNHRTLDLRRVHLPEEFSHGKAPTRRLVTDREAKMPGYKKLLDSPEVRAAILAKHGKKKNH